MTQPSDEPPPATSASLGTINIADADTPRYADLTELDTDDLKAFLARIAEHRGVVPSIGGQVVAVLLARDGVTERSLEADTGIPKSTIHRWSAPFRTAVAS